MYCVTFVAHKCVDASKLLLQVMDVGPVDPQVGSALA